MWGWLEDGLALLAPELCGACDERLDSAGVAPFCAAHAPLLERLPYTQGGLVRAACAYGGPMAEAVQRFKYGGRTELAAGLARLWWPLLEGLPPLDWVVPIPLHPRRLRARGYNQAALLGATVAKKLRVPLGPHLLDRIVDNPPQTALGGMARSENVRGVFRAHHAVKGRQVLLIDDVCTTGSTLTAAAEALRQRECASIMALVLARAEPGR